MQDKLMQLEKKYGVDWREYEIEDLFKIDRGNISKQGELIENPDGIAFVAQNDNSNGFVKMVEPADNKIFDGKTIAIGRQTGVVYYQPKKFVTTDGVLVLSALTDCVKSDRIGLYLTALIQKQLLMFGYTNTVSVAKLKPLKLDLPTKNGEIAYEFMNEFVETLEAERLATLEAYLKATGLNNAALSAKEAESLDKLGGKVLLVGLSLNLTNFSIISNKASDSKNPTNWTGIFPLLWLARPIQVLSNISQILSVVFQKIA